jgi:hypothetical protein
MFPEKATQEFKELYKKRFGKKLSDREASYRANNLFNLYKVTHTPGSIIEVKLPKQTKERIE